MSLLQRYRHHRIWSRHAAKVEAEARAHVLKYLFLEVTRKCNLACAYCGSGCTGREAGGELPASEFIEAIRQVASDFPANRIMVAVTGGEPLLKPGILDLFRELHRLGFPYGIVTNGRLMTPAMARDVIGAGIGSISISLDATPEINDALRGPGVFAGVEAAVVNLQDAGFKGKLEIISTITTPALATLDTLRKKIAQMRVPLWRVSPVMPIGRAAERGDLVPDCHGVRGLLEYVRASRQDGLLPKPEFSEEGFLGWRFEGFVRPYLCRCHAGVSVGGIKCDGRIGACPELGDAFDQGHIGKDRFKDVWDTGYQAMRDRRWTRASGPCSECERWPICRGGALHLYPAPGKPFLRCLYLQCKEAEIPRT